MTIVLIQYFAKRYY